MPRIPRKIPGLTSSLSGSRSRSRTGRHDLFQRTRSPAGLAWALACSCLFAVACSSTGGASKGPQEIEVDEINPTKIDIESQPIGKFLADFDIAMQAWTSLKTTASTPAERRKAREIENVLINRSTKRFDDLIEQLENGPPHNRIRSASAVAFSGREEALGPLLAALSDPYGDVVNNALLGLALLASPDTPLEPLCALMINSGEPDTRGNAGYALRTVIGKGADGEVARSPARLALTDGEPFVRVQAALVLGLLGDADSVPPLSDQVYDELPLVAQAAIQALLMIAEDDPINRGPVARALIPARTAADPRVQERVRRSLVQIAGIDYGKDADDWVEWADGLP